METFWQLVLAVLLGGLLGLEREYSKKEAGLRTFALVSLGAAFFTIISFEVLGVFAAQGNTGFDPARIIGQIVLGIGFIGAGSIIHRESHVEGLTTAAGLWIAAAIGASVGVKLYIPAIFVTVLALIVMALLIPIEKRFIKKEKREE